MVFTSKFSWLNFAKGEENDHLFKHTNGSGCHSTVMQILKGGGSALCMQALEPHLPSQVGYLALFNLLIHLAICLIYCACVGEGLGVESGDNLQLWIVVFHLADPRNTTQGPGLCQAPLPAEPSPRLCCLTVVFDGQDGTWQQLSLLGLN